MTNEHPLDVDPAGAAARLTEMAAAGGPVEVIVLVSGTLGAGAGTAAAMAGDANAATFPSGTDVTARILAPITIIVEK